MKTKFLIPGLLAALMLVTVPIITVAVTEKPEVVTMEELNPSEETPSEDSTLEESTEEETTVEEICVDGTCVEETTVEEPTEEETTMEHTEYISFGFVKASFSGVYDSDVDFQHGLFFTKDITVTSATSTLIKPLKINGKTIVESGTPVKLEINLMGNLGFRMRLSNMVDWTPSYQITVSGFASGITVTY